MWFIMSNNRAKRLCGVMQGVAVFLSSWVRKKGYILFSAKISKSLIYLFTKNIKTPKQREQNEKKCRERRTKENAVLSLTLKGKYVETWMPYSHPSTRLLTTSNSFSGVGLWEPCCHFLCPQASANPHQITTTTLPMRAGLQIHMMEPRQR